MKDKKKLIEEIVKITSMRCGECDTCKFNDMRRFGGCTDYLIANELYKQGYRKIDKDSVVLSREVFKQLLDNNIRVDIEYLEQQLSKERKETAENILLEFEYCNDTTFYETWLKLCKKFSVDF